jgi:hypothetical protein
MRRSLIEKTLLAPNSTKEMGFTQQPMVMEYMTEKLIDCVTIELETATMQLFISHALTKASAKDFVRSSQVRTILSPISTQFAIISNLLQKSSDN